MDNSNNFSEIVAMVPLEDETDEDMSDLTMADKRAHHNALERKRRDHIKDSFYCLRDAVPQLRGEKVVASRALILNKATDYIKGLRTKNHCHKREIDDIKRQNEVLEQEIERIMRLNNSKEPDCKTLSSLTVSGEEKEKSHIRSSPPTWSRLSEVEDDGLFIGKQPKQEEYDEPSSKQPNNSKQSVRGEPKYPPLKDSNYVTKLQDPNYKETNYKSEVNHKPQSSSGGTIQIPASALAKALPNGFKQKVTAIYKHTGSNKPIRLQIITPNKGGTPGTKTITTNAKIISNRTVTTSRTVTQTSRTLTTGSNPVRPSTAGPPATRPAATPPARPSSAINRPSAATISSSNAPLQTNQRSNPPVQHVASPAERREDRRASPSQGDSPITVMHGARAPPGQNPFHCTICGKCFPMLSSLKVHEHIHVPVKKKPYPCDMCHRSFMTQRILQNHKEGHYGRISLPHRQIAQVRQKVANYSTHPPGYSSSPLDPPAVAVTEGSSPNPHSPRTTISNIFHVRAASPRETTTSPVQREGNVITLVPKALTAAKPGQRSLPTTRVRQGQVIVQARPGGTSYKSPGSKTNRADLSPYGNEERELGETPQYSKRLLHGGTMRLHGGSLVAASDSIHNPNQGTVRVTEPSHPKFKYGVGNEENKRARNFPASLKRSAPPKEETEDVESKHLKSGS